MGKYQQSEIVQIYSSLSTNLRSATPRWNTLKHSGHSTSPESILPLMQEKWKKCPHGPSQLVLVSWLLHTEQAWMLLSFPDLFLSMKFSVLLTSSLAARSEEAGTSFWPACFPFFQRRQPQNDATATSNNTLTMMTAIAQPGRPPPFLPAQTGPGTEPPSDFSHFSEVEFHVKPKGHWQIFSLSLKSAKLPLGHINLHCPLTSAPPSFGRYWKLRRHRHQVGSSREQLAWGSVQAMAEQLTLHCCSCWNHQRQGSQTHFLGVEYSEPGLADYTLEQSRVQPPAQGSQDQDRPQVMFLQLMQDIEIGSQNRPLFSPLQAVSHSATLVKFALGRHLTLMEKHCTVRSNTWHSYPRGSQANTFSTTWFSMLLLYSDEVEALVGFCFRSLVSRLRGQFWLALSSILLMNTVRAFLRKQANALMELMSTHLEGDESLVWSLGMQLNTSPSLTLPSWTWNLVAMFSQGSTEMKQPCQVAFRQETPAIMSWPEKPDYSFRGKEGMRGYSWGLSMFNSVILLVSRSQMHSLSVQPAIMARFSWRLWTTRDHFFKY